MTSLLEKPKDCFAYIQVEATEIIFQVYRFQERVYDAVLMRVKSTTGDFRVVGNVAAPLSAYVIEAQKIPQCRIIIGLHSGLFSTVQTEVTIRRDNPERLIDEAELENLISSGLWKMVSRDQKELARKMNAVESSVVVCGALITQVRIDGHRVASPVGFPAHTVELKMLYSAGPQGVYQVLAPFLSGEKEIYCTEIGMSELLRLADQGDSTDFLLMRVSEAYTYVYESSASELAYADTITWGRNSLIGSLVQELMISQEQAIEILQRADSGLTSDYVRRRIETLLLQEVSVLLKGIGARADRGQAEAVYISAPFSLSNHLFGDLAAKRAGISVPILQMPNNSHGGKTQSALPLSMKPTASSISALCANAWAANRSFEQSDLQKIAKRRARWIAGGSTRI